MNRENCNSDICILVFLRPADSLCSALSSFLRQQRYEFTICSNIYKVFNQLEKSDRQTVLILRPAMLSAEAAGLLEQRYRNLRQIGWLDANERLSDRAFGQSKSNGMVMVSHLDQLERMIDPRVKNRSEQTVACRISDHHAARLEYEVSEDEINALLGVE